MKNQNKLLISVLFIGIIAGIYFIFKNPVNKKPNSSMPETNQQVTWGYHPIAVNLPLFVAIQQKYFEKNGLNVKLVPFQDGGLVNNGIFTEKLDGGNVGLPIFLAAQATSDSLKIRIIQVQIENKNSPVYELIVNKSIKNFNDLQGKKIGYFPATPASTISLKAVLDKRNIKADIIPSSPTTIVQAFEASEFDAIFSLSPQTTLAKKKNLGYSIVENHGIVAESIGILPLPVGAYLLSDKFVKEKPDAAKKIVLSFDEAIDFIRKHPDQAKKALEKYLPPQQKSLAPSTPIIENWKSTEIQTGKIKDYQKVLLEKGALKKPVDIDSLIFK